MEAALSAASHESASALVSACISYRWPSRRTYSLWRPPLETPSALDTARWMSIVRRAASSDGES